MTRVHLTLTVAITLLSLPALADQDEIILDPTGGKMVGWLNSWNGSTTPGGTAVIRDDMVRNSDNWHRLICYWDEGATPSPDWANAKGVRYTIAPTAADITDPSKHQLVVIKMTASNWLRFFWGKYQLYQDCKHLEPDACQHTGMPPELFGYLVGGEIQVRPQSGGWITLSDAARDKKIKFASVVNPALLCKDIY